MSDEVEREATAPLAQIFATQGQAAYRRYERRAIQRLIRTRRHIVIAAGGGLVAEAANFQRLLASAFTVWLYATPEEHWDRVVRNEGDSRVTGGASDARAMADMRRILEQRERLYRKADASLDTTAKSPNRPPSNSSTSSPPPANKGLTLLWLNHPSRASLLRNSNPVLVNRNFNLTKIHGTCIILQITDSANSLKRKGLKLVV